MMVMIMTKRLSFSNALDHSSLQHRWPTIFYTKDDLVEEAICITIYTRLGTNYIPRIRITEGYNSFMPKPPIARRHPQYKWCERYNSKGTKRNVPIFGSHIDGDSVPRSLTYQDHGSNFDVKVYGKMMILVRRIADTWVFVAVRGSTL